MISVLCPYRPDGAHHDANWEAVRPLWESLPDSELIVEGDGNVGEPVTFHHSKAVNTAARRASGDLFLIADIDILPDHAWVSRAVEAIKSGAFWVTTETYEKQGEDGGIAEVVFSSCAPPLLMPREAFELVGGYDERFRYWGADDGALRICIDTLWGPLQRVEGAARHLWHPPAPFIHEHEPAQQQLLFRYIAAAGDPDAVREVRFG